MKDVLARAWAVVSADLVKAGVTALVAATATYWGMRATGRASAPVDAPAAFSSFASPTPGERMASLETDVRAVKGDISEIKTELRDLNAYLRQ